MGRDAEMPVGVEWPGAAPVEDTIARREFLHRAAAVAATAGGVTGGAVPAAAGGRAAADSADATGAPRAGAAGSGRFRNGRTVTALDYMQSQRRRLLLMHQMAGIMKDFDMYVSGSGELGLTNQTGHRTVVVPYAMSEGEHPQPVCTTLVGRLFADDKILVVAHAYQVATAWHTHHPRLS